ncbi:hypothetical protein ACH46N_20950 [Streptomyces pristinaespiralis]|uniref:Membrane protein n=2 Tax=Streptomyces pristinaespiralis TaxID=38300 RepID=A0A0M3QIF5_STRPR|nr:membrane protein [Streptomyces pristinaespiralis]QMU15866.1 hypothetical protein H3L99_21510 [Streptomyces pristinaespiralis]
MRERWRSVVAVQEAGRCDECVHGARESHRRAVAEFVGLREGFAAGQGLPAGVAHSPGASRQWVSDELTQAARTVRDRGREADGSRLRRLRLRSLIAVWTCLGVLGAVQLVTAMGAGWTGARTAGLLAALAVAGALTAGAHAHRARGGLLAPLAGEDNRLSTSRSVATAWVLVVCYAVLVIALQQAWSSTSAEHDRLLGGLALGRGAGLLTVLALVCAVAVLVRRVVAVRVQAQRLQKVPADRPHPRDLVCDDDGRAAFADVQYVLVSAAALTYTLVRLGRSPGQLPELPWGAVLLMTVSAMTYLAAKYAEGGRPVVMSVVRAREAGDLDGPIRTGDDIELRGSGFVPPGAGAPDRLARMVVRIGSVHVHVPLIPVPGGFANPTDTVLTVPVPAEVEPGQVDVQVVTAAGVESNRCLIEVTY